MKRQAIAGVSAGIDRVIETEYPSISASAPGRIIGIVCDSIPLRIGGVKLSALLFGLPMAPFAVVGYAVTKLFGQRYVLTNRAVRIKSAIGERLFREIPLGDIDNIAINKVAGQKFFHAGNLVLLKAGGDALATLEGVTRPERFRQVILDVREARRHNDASLATIDARHPQPA